MFAAVFRGHHLDGRLMALFRETKLTWRGEEYFVTPSNRILRRIEGEGVYLDALGRALRDGKVPIGQLSYVIATLLQTAGARITEDDVLEDLTDGDADVIETLALAALTALSPEQHDEKKHGARGASTSGKRRTKRATRA